MTMPKRSLLKVVYEPEGPVKREYAYLNCYVFVQSLDDMSMGTDNITDYSLVLIHGLNGHFMETWTWKEGDQKVFWPEKLLPDPKKGVPNTRVLSFGYNGDIDQNTCIAGIPDIATTLLSWLKPKRRECENRPLVFVTHCLGGIIAKTVCGNERCSSLIALLLF